MEKLKKIPIKKPTKSDRPMLEEDSGSSMFPPSLHVNDLDLYAYKVLKTKDYKTMTDEEIEEEQGKVLAT